MSINVGIHPKSFEAQSNRGTVWVNIEAGGGSYAAIFLNTPADADELIKAAVAAKSMILGETSAPIDRGRYDAASAAEVAEGVEGAPPFHARGIERCRDDSGHGYVCTAQRGHGGPDHVAYIIGSDDKRWPVTAHLDGTAGHQLRSITIPAGGAA